MAPWTNNTLHKYGSLPVWHGRWHTPAIPVLLQQNRKRKQLAWLLCSSQKQKKHCLEQSGEQGLTVERILWPPHSGCPYTAHARAHAHTWFQKIFEKASFSKRRAGGCHSGQGKRLQDNSPLWTLSSLLFVSLGLLSILRSWNKEELGKTDGASFPAAPTGRILML